MLRIRRDQRQGGRLATIWPIAGLLALAVCPLAVAVPLAGTATTAAVPMLPEPILWKQSRFLIPYQWSPTADQPQSVRLFISKDRGLSWQAISEAQPHLRGFTYHAEQDGEFWFSIRTIDALGRAWPNEPHRPELRVIVDTTFPEIGDLGGTLHADGRLEVYWSARDAMLDVSNIKIEVQVDGTGSWQPIALPQQFVGPDGINQGRAAWQLAPNTNRVLLRAEIYDQAGNRSFRGAEVLLGQSSQPGANQYPTMVIRPDELPYNRSGADGLLRSGVQPPAAAYPSTSTTDPFAFGQPSSSMPSATAEGWQAASPGVAQAPSAATPQSQPWPANHTSNQAWNSASPALASAARADSAMYPSPQAPTLFGPADKIADSTTSPATPQHGSSPPFGPIEPYRSVSYGHPTETTEDGATNMRDAPHEPFAHDNSASAADAPATGNSLSIRPQPTNEIHSQVANSWQANRAVAGGRTIGGALPEGIQPMMVGQRTFDLDYALEEVGSWGVSRVELWGTRDGGRSWRQYAFDDDNRSPIRVTVEGEGVFGFRIVAHSPGGPGPTSPRSGDLPELWVGVDLEPPRAELVAVEQGTGNLADHLIVRWRAEDANLDQRPIALFYSSRAGGPWTSVATGLENTGEYAWRLERHLPAQFYLRLEARDTASNLTAYQTSQPIILNRAQPAATLRGVRPPGSASAIDPSPAR